MGHADPLTYVSDHSFKEGDHAGPSTYVSDHSLRRGIMQTPLHMSHTIL